MKKVSRRFGVYFILISSFWSLLGCNLCPNNPDNSAQQDELLISYFSANGNSILVLSNTNTFSFKEIISDINFHSVPAENGDFCFIRKNYQTSNSALFIGNIFSRKQKLVEIENQIFSIINPVISPKSNAISFSGGKNQLYIWLFNPVNNSSYIDKISNSFLDNSIPVFSHDGNLLCFLEQEANQITLSVIDINKPDEIIKKYNFYGNTIIFGQETRLSITNDNKIFFISADENKYYLNLVDLNNNIISKNEIAKNTIQITTGEISWNGAKALIVSNDGIIWLANFTKNNLKVYQLTQLDNCSRFVDVRWKRNSDTFIALRSNCESVNQNAMNLYIMTVEEVKDDIKLSTNVYYSSNVVNAYWR